MLVDDAIVYVKLRTAARWGSDQFEPRIQRISLLSDVMDEMAKGLILQVPIDNLNEPMTNHIVDALQKNKGNCKVKVEFFDFVNNYKVETSSSKYKVLCSGATRQLRMVPGIHVKVKT